MCSVSGLLQLWEGGDFKVTINPVLDILLKPEELFATVSESGLVNWT